MSLPCDEEGAPVGAIINAFDEELGLRYTGGAGRDDDPAYLWRNVFIYALRFTHGAVGPKECI